MANGTSTRALTKTKTKKSLPMKMIYRIFFNKKA